MEEFTGLKITALDPSRFHPVFLLGVSIFEKTHIGFVPPQLLEHPGGKRFRKRKSWLHCRANKSEMNPQFFAVNLSKPIFWGSHIDHTGKLFKNHDLNQLFAFKNAREMMRNVWIKDLYNVGTQQIAATPTIQPQFQA